MLSLQSSSPPQKCTPNLLPARLHHNGPITSTPKYWQPSKTKDGKIEAYFRGRHLHGTALPLPENYTGAVLHVTEKELPRTQTSSGRVEDEDEDEDEAGEEMEEVEVKVVERVGSFEEVVVWGHGAEVDGSRDMYVRGLGEWIGFAEAMHGEGEEAKSGKTT